MVEVGELGSIDGRSLIMCGRKYPHTLFSYRNIYCVVAVDICRLCPTRFILLVLSTTQDGYGEVVATVFLPHQVDNPLKHRGSYNLY